MSREVPDMMTPQKLDATAAYLQQLMDESILRNMVMEKYLPAVRSVFDNLELRQIHDQIVKEVVGECKDKKKPYAVHHFRNTRTKATVPGDETLIEGVYLEVVNPVTNKNIVIPMETVHNITKHRIPGFKEVMRNLGDSPMGYTDNFFEIANFLKVCSSLDMPDQVGDELEAIQPDIEYLVGSRFASMTAEARELDRSGFENDEYERERNLPSLFTILQKMVEWGADDIHIKAGCRPIGVMSGDVTPHPEFEFFLEPEDTQHYAYRTLSEEQILQFEETREMDTSFAVPGVARFRCNVYWAQGTVGMVLRLIPNDPLPTNVLIIPQILKKLVFERLGLVLVTGQTGSGKTTTLASIIEFANQNRSCHILTLENPVEYVYTNKQSIFTQRAVEIDSLSFPMGMRAALREKPDIILIGEMRDQDTIIAGLKAAETGHLVLSTLHTNDSVQTINRLINTFPPHEQEQVRLQLSETIRASVSQRLLKRWDKPGRVCSIEILLITPNARGDNSRDYIRRNEINELYKVIETSPYDGMQSGNMSLFEFYDNCVISGSDALALSDNPEQMSQWMRRVAGKGIA
ncbi:MAG: PilT/PilU family type 4a pilus ATPase [Candidatus Sericytochromatia bacterium]|nr:PilT/PilU family type 4a pilus ATPase [Candidatus Sericytochromatia bacterium]